MPWEVRNVEATRCLRAGCALLHLFPEQAGKLRLPLRGAGCTWVYQLLVLKSLWHNPVKLLSFLPAATRSQHVFFRGQFVCFFRFVRK